MRLSVIIFCIALVVVVAAICLIVRFVLNNKLDRYDGFQSSFVVRKGTRGTLIQTDDAQKPASSDKNVGGDRR